MLLAKRINCRRTAAYFGDGERIPHGLPLPVMPRVHGVKLEEQTDHGNLQQTPEILSLASGAVPRNHDELTLRMLTDMERSYMNDSMPRKRPCV